MEIIAVNSHYMMTEDKWDDAGHGATVAVAKGLAADPSGLKLLGMSTKEGS